MEYQAAFIGTGVKRMDGLAPQLAEAGIDLEVLKGPQTDSDLAKYDAIAVDSSLLSKDIPFSELDPEKCKLVLAYSIGVNQLDLGVLTEKCIMAANLVYGSEQVPQNTMGNIYALANHIIEVHQGATSKDALVSKAAFGRYRSIESVPLGKKKLGIVGYGRIGKRLAEMAQPVFGEVVGYDPFIEQGLFPATKVTGVKHINDLLEQCEFVTLHLPKFESEEQRYTDKKQGYKRIDDSFWTKTTDMIGRDEIARMPADSYLINAARGGIVVEAAVFEALRSEHLAGAAFDVFKEEPLTEKSQWLYFLNRDVPTSTTRPITSPSQYTVLATPHRSFNLEGTFAEMEMLAAEEIIRVIIDEELPDQLINPAVLHKK